MTHPQVYSPHEDTLLLLEAAQREILPGDRILEVGCGSGYILSHLSGRKVAIGTDINPHAVRVSRNLGLDVVRADLLAGLRGPFDLVLFNPPYLPTLPEERLDDWLEHALDGGPDGATVIRRFLADVDRVLSPWGRVLLLLSSLTGKNNLQGLPGQHGFTSERVLECRIEGETLFVIRLRKKIREEG